MKKEIKHTQKNPRPMPKRLNNTVFMTYFENLRDEKVTHIRELITVSGTGLFIWVNVIIVFTVSSQTTHFLWTLHKHMRCWLINKTMLYKFAGCILWRIGLFGLHVDELTLEPDFYDYWHYYCMHKSRTP